jgi:hypothetical protein
MWTIEQAVKHYETLASRLEDICLKPASEYPKQTAAWLRELKERREAPEIVRCGECEHFRKEHDGEMWCGISKGHGIDKDFFCRDAERRTE